jgi:hypothetical protein
MAIDYSGFVKAAEATAAVAASIARNYATGPDGPGKEHRDDKVAKKAVMDGLREDETTED